MLEIFNFISKVKAASLPNITNIDTPIGSKFTTAQEVVLAALNLVFEVAGGLLLIAVVYSGILYVTAGGDMAKTEAAKKNLIWALIGLVVMVLAVVIVGWVQTIVSTNAPT